MPQLPYKYFGQVSGRTVTSKEISEYDPRTVTFQPRVNDLYIFCPPFGNDVANAVIWTPGFKRVQSDNDVAKSNYLEFRIEEIVSPANTSTNANINRVPYSSLEALGITMYVKFQDETALEDYSAIRETVVTPLAVKALTGICAANGSVVSAGINNVFGLTLGWAFCLGLRMDKGAALNLQTYRGRYYYYLVNRNPSNDAEIVWRMCFIIGGTTGGATNPVTIAGTTLPFGTYVITNADRSEPTQTISIEVNGTPTTFTLNGAIGDNQNYGTFFPAPGITLNIDYSLISATPPSGDGYLNGTDNPIGSGALGDIDFRPYTVNSFPVV
jgi:hypothetical protein